MSRPTRRIVRSLALLAACCLCLGSGLAFAATGTKETYAIRLQVEPAKLKRNETAKLLAIVEPSGTCGRRAVLFEIKDGRGWDKLGRKVDVDSSCRVSRKVKVDSRSVFRVLLIDPRKSETLVASPGVTVKLR